MLMLVLFYPNCACVVFWNDVIAISTSHSRCNNLLFRKVGHAVLGDEVVAVDWRTMLSASEAR